MEFVVWSKLQTAMTLIEF